jgi:very-short-patch-repair endonuclease
MSAIEADPGSIGRIIQKKLDEARDTLIDRNLRNKLVNCQIRSQRARQIGVVDEVADEVFQGLLGAKREYVFAPGRRADHTSEGETDAGLVPWVPSEDDLDEDGVARRHRDNALQTRLTAENLQKRLTAIYYEAQEVEQEQGVNVLYLALGFIKWFETGRSEEERFAPLILVPVELTREGARERFKLRMRYEDIFTNVSLRLWLGEQHSIELPELPEGDEWKPSQYFEQVRSCIANSPRWEVLDAEILLSFFSFNKYMLWRDLDPKNWPSAESLLGHKVLRQLLGPAEVSPTSEPPVIPHDARIDNVFKLSELTYVLDADSSQTTAIQAAMAGRNLVIQGPPGTGKSQTIANIIGSAIAKGKSVLFVAEKLAALQVVFERLKGVGLGHLCLELHSRKASKQQVLQQLREALDAPTPPKVPSELKESLDRHASDLWKHSDRMHREILPSGLTPFVVIGHICRLRDRNVALPDFRLKDAEQKSLKDIKLIFEECDKLAERLGVSGVPAKHPWRGCERDSLSPFDQERLGKLTHLLVDAVKGLLVVIKAIWPLVRPTAQSDLGAVQVSQLEKVASALDVASRKPNLPVEVLCSSRWATNPAALDALASCSQRLASIEQRLNAIFVATAWDRDWADDRASIAASGESLFRVFRGEYRQSIRTLRGACKTFPAQHETRVSALDSLMEGIKLRRELAQRSDALRQDLGSLADELPKAWPQVQSLATWIAQAVALEPALSIRNPRLLAWSENHAAWASKLMDVATKVRDATVAVATFVQFEDCRIGASDKRVDWTLAEVVARAQAWSASIERYNEWPPTRTGMRQLEAVTEGDFGRRCYTGAVPASEIGDRVRLATFEQLWNSAKATDAELGKADGKLLADTVMKFRDLDRKRIRAASDEVSKRHHDQKPTGNVGDMGVIRSELNKMRKHLPVRRLLEKAGNAVQLLKPVFLMSPLSVSQYLMPGRVKFDLLLIDEASQVRPADALAAVARAEQVVVVGDAKQLPPTNFFNRLVNDEDDAAASPESVDDVSPPLGAMESILSLSDATFSSREMLKWHYRSQHPGLVAVSNRNFYDRKLLLPPSVLVGRAADGLGVYFHLTPSGHYERGRSAANVVEADIVAEAVCEFARRHSGKTLGVGAFSRSQSDAIRDRVDTHRRAYPELEPFFSPNAPNPFFVKNLESIQGDERDVIFISIGYGRDQDGRLTQNFGPINANGGERRLNVLITRARERCEVFSSIRAEDIDTSGGKPGTVALREFLQYAEKGYFDVPTTTDRSFDSDFEESVADFLRSRGLKVDPQVGMAGFYIDLGVIDPSKPTRYLLGVECDGATYHSSRSARDRDRIRQDILESRGWTIHRVWSTDWFHRRKQEELKLLDALGRAASDSEKSPNAPKRPRQPATSPQPTRPSVGSGTTEAPKSRTRYVEANFRVNIDRPPHEASTSDVADAMLRIVRLEGPIHEEEACRRLASVWGLERAGNRIREAGLRALALLHDRGSCGFAERFWTVVPSPPIVVRDRSEAASAALRRAEYLPPAEICAAAVQVLNQNARVHRDDLIVEISRRFGFQRTGEDLKSVIDLALDSLVGSEATRDDEGNFSPMSPQAVG